MRSQSILPKHCNTYGIEDGARVFRIDAICVDQSDIPERGHQVVRMADVGPQARRVVVWLGPERVDGALAMRGMNTMGSTVEVSWQLFQIIPLSSDGFNQRLNETSPFIADRKVLACLESLLDGSWFKRLWSWQENWTRRERCADSLW